MKTMYRVNAPASGTVDFVVALGEVIAEGDTICWITELDEGVVDLSRIDKVI